LNIVFLDILQIHLDHPINYNLVALKMSLPKEMRALRYTKPKEYSIVTVPLPELRDNDVLIKVKACGVCGTEYAGMAI
jgi:hypothetical protein